MNFSVFNSRETALLIWVALLLVALVTLPKLKETRKSIRDLLWSFFQWKIQIVFLLMVNYILATVYMLARIGLWDFSQIKNTVIWTFSVGFLLIFQIDAIKKNSDFLRRVVLDNLKLIAILEFFIGLYTFSLVIELLLLPLITLVALMSAVAARDEKYKPVKSLLNGFLSIFGLFLLVHAIYNVVSDTNTLMSPENFYDFVIPPLLTLLYLPFLLVLMVFMSYEGVLITLPRFIENKKKRIFAIIATMLIFNVRVKLLERWRHNLLQEDTNSYKGIWLSILKIFQLRAKERRSKIIPLKEGWSPYIAKDKLKKHGLETGYYQESYDNWSACSRMIDVSEGILADNIAYYIEGNEDAATALKLVLNVNHSETAEKSKNELLKVARSLYFYAIGAKMPQSIHDFILSNSEFKKKIGRYLVELELYKFKNSKLGGFDVKFSIHLMKRDSIA